MFEVLSISSHMGAQPSVPLTDGLVNNTLYAPDQAIPKSSAASFATSNI